MQEIRPLPWPDIHVHWSDWAAEEWLARGGGGSACYVITLMPDGLDRRAEVCFAQRECCGIVHFHLSVYLLICLSLAAW